MKNTKLLYTIKAYDNTLTGLIGPIYQALDIVSREQVGFIPSAYRNSSAERAAKNQAITYPISPIMPSVDIDPSMTIPNPADFTAETGSISITKAKSVPFGLTGEEVRGLSNTGTLNPLQVDMIAQGFRTLVNEMEIDLATAAAANASVAYGTGGTTPFDGTLKLRATAEMKKLLDDAGATPSERSLIIDSTAGVNLRSLTQLTNVNEAGSSMTLRDGELGNLSGFSIKESAGVTSHVKGTAASATTTNAGFAKGATVIALASAGTGTILVGDYVSFAGDSTLYLVTSGDADVSGGGSITIASPGLKEAIPASTTAITVAGSSTRNIAFQKNALHLVTRAPVMPEGGDAAFASMMIPDVRSGLVFEVRQYKGYHMNRFEVGAAWGVGAVKGAHIAALLG